MKIQRIGESTVLDVVVFDGSTGTKYINIDHESGEERSFFMLGSKYIDIGDYVVVGTNEIISSIMFNMYYKVVS